MQAIITRYLGPTNTRGSRIKATADAGSATIPYPHELGPGEPAHRLAAETLRDRLEWAGALIGGALPDGRYAFVFAPGESDADPDADDRSRCTCRHFPVGAFATADGADGKTRCTNYTRHSSGECGDCRGEGMTR